MAVSKRSELLDFVSLTSDLFVCKKQKLGKEIGKESKLSVDRFESTSGVSLIQVRARLAVGKSIGERLKKRHRAAHIVLLISRRHM